jgi:hypothetical protein
MVVTLGSRPRRSRLPAALIGIGVVVVAVAVASQLRVGRTPDLRVATEVPAIGPESSLTVAAAEGSRGVAHVQVRVQQGELDRIVFDQRFPTQPAHAPWQPVPAEVELSIPVGARAVEGLSEGEATITVEARGAGTLLRSGPSTTETWSGPVLLAPPALTDVTSNTWVAQGGAEAVVYAVGPTATRHGVRAGEFFFPGHRHEALGEGMAFALFVVPHDMSDIEAVKLVAEDLVENRSEIRFVDRFEPRPLKTDIIRITDRVMEAVVPEIMARTPSLEDRGSLLANYLQINGDLRERLAERLLEIGKETAPSFLWSKPFVQMPAKVVSAFADRRTYLYEGEKVDQQDHLGFDLASVRHDEVPASNDGSVVLAEYFGIYGNTIIVDHGYGLMSLYAHLSRMDVGVGDDVTRGQTIGRTGATGLALGDHLHFTTLLYGVPTTPMEWWDGHWIEDRIASKLGAVLRFEDD